MATATKIVVHFDDGSTMEASVAGMSSVFFNEAAAIKCGHRPPYQNGPPPSGGGTVTTTSGGGGTCYYYNGVIICP